jgi:hypothetical protein
MRSNAQVQHQINALAADLLLTGAHTALKFLNVAKRASASKEDREDRYEEAFMIYNAILKFLPGVPMNREQKAALKRRLTVVRSKLDLHFAGHSKAA